MRSITLSLLSGTAFFGSAGSILIAFVTSAMDSSGAMAALDGGPTTAAGAAISAMTLGGETLRSSSVTLSAPGGSKTALAPSISVDLPSLAEMAS